MSIPKSKHISSHIPYIVGSLICMHVRCYIMEGINEARFEVPCERKKEKERNKVPYTTRND